MVWGVATISGDNNFSNIDVEGVSPGNATIFGRLYDQYGCEYGQYTQMKVTGDQTPVIAQINPSVWPAGATTQVTFTGQNFGSNQPALSYSDSTITTQGFSSYSDTQIVAYVNVPSGTPNNEEVEVTVTNNGYGGNSWMSTGGNPQSGNATATIAGNGPSANVSIKFTGSKSSGDGLEFLDTSYDCSGSLGLQNCPTYWLWNIEGTAAVSDDATYWTVTQSVSGRYKGYEKLSNGNLASFDHSVSVTNDNPTSPFSLQQTIDTKTIYWIDAPGLDQTLADGNPIDSLTLVFNFSTTFCSTQTNDDCFTTTWYEKLIVNPGGKLDTVNSTAALGAASTNF